MNPLTANDTAEIAAQFEIREAHLQQASFIAFSKIQLYKLSRVQAAYCKSKAEMEELVFLFFIPFCTTPSSLADFGFCRR